MIINKKKIIIIAAAAFVIIGAFIIAVISGNGISSRFSGKNMVQAAVTQESTVENTVKNTGDNSVENTKTGADSADTEVKDTTAGQVGENTIAGEQQDKTADGSGSSNGIKKIKVKAIYLSGTSAGSTKVLDRYIDLINRTELNAVVIDIKEAGRVNYKSSIPFVAENGLYNKYYDADKVIKKLHDNNIYVIGRIVCFRDNGLASKRADLAIKRTDGSIWKEGKLGAWTNPYMEEVWQYNIDIAKEAVSKGFDEIQFDYVRFPTAKKSEVNYGSNLPSKVDTICSFLELAKKELHDGMGVPVSADVFGIIAESRSDGEAIGQDLEKVGMNIDYISPMVYPSHYAKGQEVNGVKFEKPDFDPYGVVYQTLVKAKERISKVQGYTADVRPYLQDFTASYLHKGDYQEYGAEQVRQQIKAVYDAGYEQWILWDGKNTYTEGALELK